MGNATPMVDAFRFEDGKAFDFRGDEERTSSGYAGYLGNSSERASKGKARKVKPTIARCRLSRVRPPSTA